MPSADLFLRSEEDGLYRWELWRRGECAAQGAGQSAAEVRATAFDGEAPEEIVLLTPARRTPLYRISFSSDERRHLLQTVPYLLEEQLASNIDKLHFALGSVEQENAVAAVLERNWLEQRLLELQEAELTPDACIPEQQLLEAPAGGWCCRLQDGELTVHTASGRGLCCNAEIMAPLLELLAENEFPGAIRFIGASDALEQFREALPQTLQDAVIEALEDAPPPPSSPAQSKDLLNLLQGEFRKRLSWKSLAQEWGLAAGLVLGIGFMYTAAVGAEYRELHLESQRLQQEATAIARSAYPQEPPPEVAALNDRLGQEQERLQDLERLQKTHFVRMMRMAGESLHSVSDTLMRRLTYDDRDRKLLMEFETRQFSNIQKVRDHLKKLGVESRLVNSNAQKGKFRVRVEFSLGGADSEQEKSS